MHKRKSSKGVGTALGTAFFIIVAILSIAALWTISGYEARYQETVDEMTEWDVDRISEDLYVRNITDIPPTGRNFTIFVDNNGGVLVNIVRIYIYNQSSLNLSQALEVYDPKNSSTEGFVSGVINTGEVKHPIIVNGTDLNPSYNFRIVLATDRGRQFSYSYPPPPGSGGSGGGGYALVIDDSHNNFQYAAGSDPTFRSAYVLGKGKNNIVYRVLIRNTTTRNIVFLNNCSMNDALYNGGGWTQRYIVGNTSTPLNHVAFSSQTINTNSSQYVYFAANSPGSTTWINDPANKGVYFVGFILAFRYQDETEVRHFGTPALTKELT